ncbi:glycogen synthase GlgA [Clostridium sp. 19966]|uniref:glycogen synthase GlgA n=1 Tax=Clostridium sp. 19966 TaxID=2768166 RepID=UPI0028DEDD99|nr:glycogen synthase GlgA [Clostridium sp. 19966]MDT8719498.1 glycogen synthase GlgA [Clostridium sp. 19966]
MRILFAASESHPFIKVGGLGDVAYALPKALRKIGVDARVIIPKYGVIAENMRNSMQHIASFNVPVGWRNQYGGLEYMEYDGVPFYFIDNEYYFKRDGIYGYYDDGERFAFFSKAILEAVRYMGDFKPDVIHCNDWHTAAVIPLYKAFFQWNYPYNNIKTVFTIHNLRYQGVFGKETLGDLLGLGLDYYEEDKMKFYDAISFMKGALNMADRITTVSSTYAEEIKTEYYGEHLDGLLRYRSYDLWGIVNGIDTDIFNPEKDGEIAYNFNGDKLEEKLKNKEVLQSKLGLAVNKNIPMIGMVTRLVDQKGLDLVACVMEDILKMELQLVVLGTGDRAYEDMFRYFAWKYPNKMSANIFFSNDLSKMIYASSDMFLMPSQFEPCGIGQLISLRYGSLPIVRETGGLKDTVHPYNEFTGEGNGFSFSNYNAHDMLYTIQRAVHYYYDEKKIWNSLVRTAMWEDNSWSKSANKYVELYNSMM